MRVIIAGAGFSKPAGIPLLRELPEHVADIIEEYRDPDDEDVLVVSQFCKSIMNWDTSELIVGKFRCMPLEDLCTAIDWAIDRRDMVSDVEPAQVAKALMNLIIRAIENCEKKADCSLYAEFLESLDRVAGRSWVIVSLNWDTLVEKAAAKRNIPLSLGPTVFQHVNGEFARFNSSREQGLLMKLHGSTSWRECPQCRGLYIATQRLVSCPRCGTEAILRRMVVPPTLIKRIHNPSLDLLWDEALYVIRAATEVLIVGYSLPPADYEMRHLLTRALRGKPQNKISVVLHPDDANNGTIARYQQLFDWPDAVFSFCGTEYLLERDPAQTGSLLGLP